MAVGAWTDPYITLDAFNITPYVQGASLTYEAELIDDTVSGDDTRSSLGGLKNWTLEIEALNNFTTSTVDEKLFALVGTTFTCVFRRTSAAAGVSNPEYGGTGILASYPIGGAIGDADKTSITINAASTLTRATS